MNGDNPDFMDSILQGIHAVYHVITLWTKRSHEHGIKVRDGAEGERMTFSERAESSIEPRERRLRILSEDEIEALYGLPHFSDDERPEYFSIAPAEQRALDQLHSMNSRIYFILQLGYFKSHHLFFVFGLPEVEADARYVQEQYYPGFELTELRITKVTRLKCVFRAKVATDSG